MTHQYVRCFEKHPALPVGGGRVIYGGNCTTPKVTDADVYVALGHGVYGGNRQYPWNPGHAFHFPITDGMAPSDKEEFAKLIAWIDEQLNTGMKVHVGCIGGHGRTGTVLSALVAFRAKAILDFTPGEDVIGYVREHYCKKAVESTVQVDFLVEHYGVKKVPGSHKTHEKTHWYGGPSTTVWGDDKGLPYGHKDYSSSWWPKAGNSSAAVDSGSAVRNKGTVWAKTVHCS